MALIKCKECGQEISTEAEECPHCGYPINKGLPVWKSIGLLILILAFFGFVLSSTLSIQIPSKLRDMKNFFTKELVNDSLYKNAVSQTNNSKPVPIKEVNNLGYIFYIGEIEESNTTNINDELKNQITKIAYTTNFPKELLKATPIIIINNLALSSDMYVPTSNGNLKIPELGGHFLSEGGLYGAYSNGAVIFINKATLTNNRLTEVLAHEFGHAIGAKITDQDWSKFYQLRNIPAGTSKAGTSWNLSPQEDFAEVYKNVFTGIAVRTYFGFLEAKYGMDMGSCQKVYLDLQTKYSSQVTDPNDPLSAFLSHKDYSKISSQIDNDPQMQSCRREIMANPSTYKTDWQYGTPYKSSVGPMTKNFITQIVNRL